MSEEDNNSIHYDLKNASAFENYNKVSTTFEEGLEKSIIELAEDKNKLKMSDILERFGNYDTVHKQVKKLVLENRLVLYELEENSIASNDFKNLELKISNPDNSQWVDLTAQPCLTCPIYNECGIDNPVSPATCQEFNTWLDEEIDLMYGSDE